MAIMITRMIVIGGDIGDEDNEEDGDSSPGIPPTG